MSVQSSNSANLKNQRLTEAVELFSREYACSQAVLGAFCASYNLDRELAMRLAAGFGRGMGGLGEVCGVLTGGIMVIGLHRGGGPEAKKATNRLVAEFFKQFRQRNEDKIICRDLLGCAAASGVELTPEQQRKLHLERCTKFLRDSVDILHDLLG